MLFRESNFVDLFNLKGKTALVTGASNRLGKQLTRCLSGAGSRMIMVSRKLEILEILSQEISNMMPS
ncbi:MAG: hypothetical protein K2W99_04740 [Chthoniobacterales bacterium]|nr:hypothetical protein [Chthoniobacterales bacterium]